MRPVLFWNNIWDFSSMRLGNKSTRNEQKGQSLLKHCFFKKELSSNWLETLRIKWNNWESFLYLNRGRLSPLIIQDMPYNYKKNDKYRQKRKICTKTMSPNKLNIKLTTKNNKNLRLLFFASDNICKSNYAHYCDTVKRKQKPTKKGQIYKNHWNWFYEYWLFQEERPFEENKTVMKSKL